MIWNLCDRFECTRIGCSYNSKNSIYLLNVKNNPRYAVMIDSADKYKFPFCGYTCEQEKSKIEIPFDSSEEEKNASYD